MENKVLPRYDMREEEQKLLQWIEKEKTSIDEVITEAGRRFFDDNKDKGNFSFELAECQAESFNLINNKDLCYDRYCTPFVYSLWYHARRLNTFIKFFTRAILTSADKTIEIFDLGAGTGAVQFAVGLVCLGMKEIGLTPPKIHVINIDISPFMLNYNSEYLWKAFRKKYQNLHLDNLVTVEYSVNSWNVKTDQTILNPWLTASYLFDISDKKEEVTSDFFEIMKHYNPSTVLLLTSNQATKVKLLNGVLEKLKTQDFVVESLSEATLLFNGGLLEVNKLRLELNQLYYGKGLERNTSWNDNSFIGTILKKRTPKLNFATASGPTQIDLFNPKIKVRKDIILNKKQKIASQRLGRPSLVIGPAGSGKSVVISEKIKFIVESQNYNPSLKILVTSFNKALIAKLGDWIAQLLNPERFVRNMISAEASTFIFSNSNEANIHVMHFDLLPTRLGKITLNCLNDEQHLNIIKEFADKLKKDGKIDHSRYDEILDPDFIYEEYHRVFYGMDIRTKDEYMNIKRRGMWHPLKKDRREIIYECINNYMHYMHKIKMYSFLTRRRFFLNDLKNDTYKKKFDYILIDEFQDCTNADFEIFFNLIHDVNNLTFAGDLAQAIQIGKSADIPRAEKMKYKKNELLEGSYRLPQRISESLEKLSKSIVTRWKSNEGVEAITPVKNSPPGARPIIVFAENTTEMAKKVNAIFEIYKIFDLKNMVILERDKELWKALNNLKTPSDTDSILRLKGLEKDCILWSTRIEINDEKEVYEFIYTILTRTSSILIISLFNDTVEIFKKVINLLDTEKLIFWDHVTKQKYNFFCKKVDIEIQENEDLDDTLLI